MTEEKTIKIKESNTTKKDRMVFKNTKIQQAYDLIDSIDEDELIDGEGVYAIFTKDSKNHSMYKAHLSGHQVAHVAKNMFERAAALKKMLIKEMFGDDKED